MRNKNDFNWGWFIFLFIILGGGFGGLIPLVLIFGAVMAITFAAVNASNRREANYNQGYRRTQNWRTHTPNVLLRYVRHRSYGGTLPEY